MNRYIKGYEGSGGSAQNVLHAFNRWPTWMWANWEIVALTEWMRKFNNKKPANKRAGFYGLDVYSLWESMDFIVKYLKKTDPAILPAAQHVLKCFEPYEDDEGLSYARASRVFPVSCETDVLHLLTEIRKKMPQYNSDHEAVFSAEQNALVAVNAERYYRAMLEGEAASWNVRDMHMMDTLNRLMQFHGPDAKCIVWAHNTHIGDARATDMADENMVNIGQLVTQQHHAKGVVKIGFGSYKGSVIAGKQWGDEMRKIHVPPSPKGTWEYMLHEAGGKCKLLFTDTLKHQELFRNWIGHRAIGVVYKPEYERLGNYVPSIIPQRYDAFIYIDETKALHPLHIKPDGLQIPETYPWGV